MTWTAESSSTTMAVDGQHDGAVSTLDTARFCRVVRKSVGGGTAANGRLRLRRFVGGEHEAVLAAARHAR